MVEAIGGVLWAAFARGAGASPFGLDVIKKGRELSRGWILHNYTTQGDGFPLAKTIECAEECGIEAAALVDWGHAITATQFAEAWETVSERHTLVIARLQRMRAANGRPLAAIRAGGCS